MGGPTNNWDGSDWNGPEYPFTTPYYPGIEYGENRSNQLKAIAISWVAISLVTIVLRTVSRIWAKVSLGLDDWLCYAATLLAWGFSGLVIAEASINGYGQHVGNLSYWQVRHFRKGLYALTVMWPVALTVGKLSLLAFYWRVFKVHKAKWPLIIVTALNLIWMVGAVIAGALTCLPVDHLWDPYQVGGCENLDAMYLVNEAITMALDLIVILMPIYFIARLKQTRSWKLNIIGTFILGLVATVVSGLREWRLAVVYARGSGIDVTYGDSTAALWSTIELNLWVIIASLPALRPLVHLVSQGRIGRMLGIKPLSGAPNSGENQRRVPEPAAPPPTAEKDEEMSPDGRVSEVSSWASEEQKDNMA